jgi:hypothetical protein
MRTLKGQLEEIGCTEAQASILLSTGVAPKWEDVDQIVQGGTTAELLASLTEIRSGTLAYLSKVTDEELHTAVHVPGGLGRYLGGNELEAEELVRWIARHEYYHLGQIVSYRWTQGHNPYASNST